MKTWTQLQTQFWTSAPAWLYAATARVLGFYVVVVCIPVWLVAKQIIDPWFNVAALTHPVTAIQAIIAFQQKVILNEELARQTLVPQLFGCCVLSILTMVLATWISHQAAKWAQGKVTYHQEQASLSMGSQA